MKRALDSVATAIFADYTKRITGIISAARAFTVLVRSGDVIPPYSGQSRSSPDNATMFDFRIEQLTQSFAPFISKLESIFVGYKTNFEFPSTNASRTFEPDAEFVTSDEKYGPIFSEIGSHCTSLLCELLTQEQTYSPMPINPAPSPAIADEYDVAYCKVVNNALAALSDFRDEMILNFRTSVYAPNESVLSAVNPIIKLVTSTNGILAGFKDDQFVTLKLIEKIVDDASRDTVKQTDSAMKIITDSSVKVQSVVDRLNQKVDSLATAISAPSTVAGMAQLTSVGLILIGVVFLVINTMRGK